MSNYYHYAAGNPIMNIDPDGKCIGAVVAIVVLGVTLNGIYDRYKFWSAWTKVLDRAKYIAQLKGGSYTSAQRLQILKETLEWKEFAKIYPKSAAKIYSAGVLGGRL